MSIKVLLIGTTGVPSNAINAQLSTNPNLDVFRANRFNVKCTTDGANLCLVPSLANSGWKEYNINRFYN